MINGVALGEHIHEQIVKGLFAEHAAEIDWVKLSLGMELIERLIVEHQRLSRPDLELVLDWIEDASFDAHAGHLGHLPNLIEISANGNGLLPRSRIDLYLVKCSKPKE